MSEYEKHFYSKQKNLLSLIHK